VNSSLASSFGKYTPDDDSKKTWRKSKRRVFGIDEEKMKDWRKYYPIYDSTSHRCGYDEEDKKNH
jgi:hypothetical protein